MPAASCHRHVQSHLRACGARAAGPATSSSSPTTMATSRTHLPPAQPNEAARRAPFEFSPGLHVLKLTRVFARTLGALSPPHPLRLGRPVPDPAPPFAPPFERRSPRGPLQALDISLTRGHVEHEAAVLGQAPRAAPRQGTVWGARRGWWTRSRAWERGGEGPWS